MANPDHAQLVALPHKSARRETLWTRWKRTTRRYRTAPRSRNQGGEIIKMAQVASELPIYKRRERHCVEVPGGGQPSIPMQGGGMEGSDAPVPDLCTGTGGVTLQRSSRPIALDGGWAAPSSMRPDDAARPMSEPGSGCRRPAATRRVQENCATWEGDPQAKRDCWDRLLPRDNGKEV